MIGGLLLHIMSQHSECDGQIGHQTRLSCYSHSPAYQNLFRPDTVEKVSLSASLAGLNIQKQTLGNSPTLIQMCEFYFCILVRFCKDGVIKQEKGGEPQPHNGKEKSLRIRLPVDLHSAIPTSEHPTETVRAAHHEHMNARGLPNDNWTTCSGGLHLHLMDSCAHEVVLTPAACYGSIST